MTEAPRPGRSALLRITEVTEETADARSLVFAVPEADRERFAYRAGQFLTLRIPSDQTGSVARCYSLASSPDTDDALKVTVKRTTDGYGSNWLCDNARVGYELEALPPSGVFTPKNLDADLLLFAGGSGITPIMSIIKAAIAHGLGQITLVYANRDESSVIFRDELRELAAAHPARLTVSHWLESLQGVPTVPALRGLAASFPGRDNFICGPGPFMAAVRSALAENGTPTSTVHVEVFTSLSGDPFAEPVTRSPADESTGTTDGCADRATVPVEVDLDGITHAFDWPVTVPLMDVLVSRGINAPFSCRDGECGSCQATLMKGRVSMIRNEVLGEEDVAEGYILTCQALPETGTEPIKIEFL
jgi:3-ketosteroid 9alpha-monooxygenase subunit B